MVLNDLKNSPLGFFVRIYAIKTLLYDKSVYRLVVLLQLRYYLVYLDARFLYEPIEVKSGAARTFGTFLRLVPQ